MNSLLTNMGVLRTLQHTHIISFVYIPRNKVAGLYGSCIFNSLRKWWAISSNGCTKLHFQVSVEGFSLLHILTSTQWVFFFCFCRCCCLFYFFSFLNSHFLLERSHHTFLLWIAFSWSLMALNIFIEWLTICLLLRNTYWRTMLTF